jgi:predicted RNA-binding protein YlxR (DUF448 family)
MGARTTVGDQDSEAEDTPLRLCAVSRARKQPEELIRFAVGPDGAIVPDLARRLPGRGVWVDATWEAVATAARQKAFARSLKNPVSVPADLPALVERLMAKRLSEALSIANKAGLVVAGFAKVQELIAQERAVVLIHAAEAAADGVGKLDRQFKGLHGSEGTPAPIVSELTSAEMSLAMGRPNVVHAAAAEGGATRRLIEEARRLRRYRLGQQPHDGAPSQFEPNTGRA